ncbi:hypothetical protein [Streptomyces sp. NPDC001985]|uniref:hypothetical protein n=1 Tax=Streptomyces sp. NPDC001985 TaxID=3154406 RepID=UPI003329C052
MTHPKRLPAAERLAASAPPGALRVVMDPDPAGKPSVLRTALAAWSSIEEGATHQLVVQDDMILSDSFFERVGAAVAELPHAALALFALWDSRNGAAVRLGAMAGARWVGAVNEYFPCVAIVLPRRVAEGFVAYGRARLDAWPDDILMYQYLRANGIPGYVSVPSLAEHEDHGSISGNAFRGPRRAVAFLPGDRPGDEGARLEGLRVIPFFKQGVAQCTVRVDGPGPERWLHLDCSDFLEGYGINTDRVIDSLKSANVGLTEVYDQEAVKGTWLTAFTMGFVHRREGRGTDLSRTPVCAEALATIGAGGVSHNRGEERIAELRDGLARLARAGVEAGLEAGAAPARRAAPAVTAPRVGVLGGATPLGEHVVRRLTDRGHTVSLVRGATGADPGVDALIDLRPLRHGAGDAGARVVVRFPDRAAGAGPLSYTLHTGDLYGPGCSLDTPIGRMVWSALRSHPVVVGEPEGAPLYPLHTADLIEAVARVLRTPPPERELFLPEREPVGEGEMAEAVRSAVRPVPLAGGPVAPGARRRGPGPEITGLPRPAGWGPGRGLHQGLHTFMQWLAYEGIRYAADPATDRTG